mmetsp:Transcript_29564/g.50343  ORF Transcript_29564/g.50343 Transcript_29564/m.50343 type:complete len:156 (-) Transcript_29564:1011-1478(-)
MMKRKIILMTYLKKQQKNFQFRLELYNRVLAGLESADHDPENLVFDKDELVQMLNTLKGNDQSLVDQSSSELGEWMGQYLKDNGYSPHTTSILMKQMFMSSFPPLMRDDEFTEENVKEYLLNSKKVLSRYAEQETKASVTKTLASSMAMHPSGWW